MTKINKLLRNKYFKIIAPIVAVLTAVGAVLIVVSPWNTSEPEPEFDEPVLESPAPGETPELEPGEIPESGVEAIPLPEPIDPLIYNPLTGVLTLEDISRNRPIAVIIGNTRDALPMNGISYADIVYEVLVEGGLTRMLAIYQDITGVGRIGSVRSARHYQVEIAASYDAIFLFSGGSEPALHAVRAHGITALTEGSRVFVRDGGRVSGRRFSAPHNLITSGELIERWLPEYDFRFTHDEDREHELRFTDNPIPGGRAADEVVVRFSGGKSSMFTFDEASNLYEMRQFNSDFVDANHNGRQVTFTNLIILKTGERSLSGPYGHSGRRDLDTVGSGDGYFVYGGRFVEIYWSREHATAQFVYTLRDGTPLELGRGRTYIGIIPTNMSADFS